MRNIKALLLTVIACLITYSNAFSQTFEDYQRQQEERLQQMQERIDSGIIESMEAWENYREREIQAFEAYKDEMEKLWGDFKSRSDKDWVEYRQDGKVRSSVDFENGTGSVEIIAESPEEVEAAQNQIRDELVATLEDRGSQREFPMEGEESKPIQDEPILAGQLFSSTASMASADIADELAETAETRQVVGADGEERTVIYVNFSLAPDHIQTRARKVEHFVYQFAALHNLDPFLIFAIIHTESHFNPAARSFANALGLMQLVPSTGGRDAYRAVYNTDGVPTQDYLFIPENNVKLGAAYVNLLMNRYLRGVQDTEVKELLMIAAYNTGTGNVARAYTGRRSVSGALTAMNKLNSEETYNFLVENLPYEETRDYVVKVTDRRAMYRDWASQ